MATTHTIGWGIVGAATTMLVRAVTRRLLHKRSGVPRLPATTHRRRTLGMVLTLAGASGVVLAFGDVLQEQRKRSAELA
jgi:hypothetical protein